MHGILQDGANGLAGKRRQNFRDVVTYYAKLLTEKAIKLYNPTMPRQPRLDILGALHYIMVRGINKTDVFIDDQDRVKHEYQKTRG